MPSSWTSRITSEPSCVTRTVMVPVASPGKAWATALLTASVTKSATVTAWSVEIRRSPSASIRSRSLSPAASPCEENC